MGGKYSKGFVRKAPPASYCPPRFSAHAAAQILATPRASALAQFAPRTKNQGNTSACTGHARSGGISTSMRAAGMALPWEPSETGLYTLARCIDRIVPGQALTDDGADLNQVSRGMQQWGIRPSRAPAPDGRNSDADPATINEEPELLELEADDLTKLIGEHVIDVRQPHATVVLQVRQALGVLKVAVELAMFVDSGVENWRAGEPPIQSVDTSDPNGGGHAVYLVDYFEQPDATTVLVVRNSWGEDYGCGWEGYGGHFLLHENALRQAEHLSALTLRRSS